MSTGERTGLFDFLSGLATAVEGSGRDFAAVTMAIAMPIELSAQEAGGRLDVTAGPSRQRTATTLIPVLHQFRLTLESGVPEDA